MTVAPYTLTARPAANRIDMQLRGFWTSAVAQRFAADLDQGLRTMRTGGAVDGQMRSLLDLADLSILSTGLTPVFRHFATNQARTCDRVAIIYRSTLALLQLQRLAAGERQFRFFRSAAEGEAWLRPDAVRGAGRMPAPDALPAPAAHSMPSACI